ncbi:MAG: Hsp20/alpha crystallin family protein [Gammaproteobacteria bacterium]|nr:Hsp20/alpha crystallin family protein [Gammaproteobacteria bacterium]
MNMIRFNPFREMDNWFKTYNRSLMHNDSDDLFNTDWSPNVDIIENDKNFEIKAELAGIPKENINIEVNKGVLTFSGEKMLESKDEKQHRIERFYGRFSRSFALPENIDTSAIKAENKDGILNIVLPKQEVVESSKKIKIH